MKHYKLAAALAFGLRILSHVTHLSAGESSHR